MWRLGTIVAAITLTRIIGAAPLCAQAPAEQITTVQTALAQPFTADFDQTPLTDVAAQIANTCNINVVFDSTSLKKVRIDPTAIKVTFRSRHTSLRASLRLLLAKLHLTWIIRHESLVVTTLDVAEEVEIVRLYDVGDLVCLGEPSMRYRLTTERGSLFDFDTLIEMVTSSVAPESWPEGTGPVGWVDEAVIGGRVFIAVRQSEQVHEKIQQLLQDLQRQPH